MTKNRKWLVPFMSFLFIIVLVMPVPVSASSAKVSSRSGTVNVRRSGTRRNTRATNGMSISRGDTVITGSNGRATVSLGGGNRVRAARSSSFVLRNAAGSAARKGNHITINYGTVYSDIAKGGNRNYKVETSNTVMGVRGTKFMVSNKIEDGKNITELNTIQGEVYAKPMEIEQPSFSMDEGGNQTEIKEITVKAGESLTVVTDPSNPGKIHVEKGTIDFSHKTIDDLEWIIEQDDEIDAEILKEAKAHVEEALQKEKELVNALEKVEKEREEKKEIIKPDVIIKEHQKEIEKQEENESDDDSGDTEPGKPVKEIPILTDVSQKSSEDKMIFTFDMPLAMDSTLDISPVDGNITTTVEANKISAVFTGAAPDTYTIGLSGVKSLTTNTPTTETKTYSYTYSAAGEVSNIYTRDDLEEVLTKYGTTPINHTVKLHDDIDWNGPWTGINIGANGVLDGNGKTISGLDIHTTESHGGFVKKLEGTLKDLHIINATIEQANVTSANDGLGLVVGKATNGEVKNITLRSSRIESTQVSVGGIVGDIDNSSIIDSEVLDVTINEVTGSSGRYHGAVVGRYAVSQPVSLENITASDIKVSGASEVGGIIGYVQSGNAPLLQVKNITASRVEVNGERNLGGIIGDLESGVVNGITLNDVKVHGSGDTIGGVVGKAGKKVEINESNITGIDISGKDEVGGVLGFASTGDSGDGNHVKVKNSIITGTGSANKIVGTGDGIGGLVGESGERLNITAPLILSDLVIQGKNKTAAIVGYSESFTPGEAVGGTEDWALTNITITTTQTENEGLLFNVDKFVYSGRASTVNVNQTSVTKNGNNLQTGIFKEENPGNFKGGGGAVKPNFNIQ